MKKVVLVFLFFSAVIFNGFSQNTFKLPANKTSDKIKFKLINNVIIIPVNLNGKTLSFILDTGVSKPIIFNYEEVQNNVNNNSKQTIFLKGLGKGKHVEAIRSFYNSISVGKAKNVEQDLYVIKNLNIGFASKLGTEIHGIIGYDLFKDFVVEINYIKKHIKLTNPEDYKTKTCRKCEVLELQFHNKKPYFNAELTVENNKIPVKLLIDTGATEALWVFENEEKNIVSTDNHFEDLLGYGLGGELHGKRSKIESFNIKSFKLDYALIAFPDSTSVSYKSKVVDRNGSVGGEILKRFHVVFNYAENTITLKKNSNFKNRFSYNKSGITIEQHGFRIVEEKEYTLQYSRVVRDKAGMSAYSTISNGKLVLKPAFIITNLRADSPAKNTGLQVGDLILKINNKETHNLSLQETSQYFYGKEGKTLNLLIDRNGKTLRYSFKLKSLLK
ncbi:aspartyl protease family protein [Lacinutrix salivirga]